MATADIHQPHPVDLHVGAMVRLRRKELGFSQDKLAEALGLTFQQVQKYERGANRVSASKLYDIARALKTTPASFYEGLAADDHAGDEAPLDVVQLIGQPGIFEIARLFNQLNSHQRGNVIRIAEAIVEATQPEDPAIAA